jgi:hypothetical protein
MRQCFLPERIGRSRPTGSTCGIFALLDPRSCRHLDEPRQPDPLPEGTWDRVGGVDPAEGVEHLLRYVLGMYAIDGVAHVLKKNRMCIQ